MEKRFLLDTNVWLDYFLDRGKLHEITASLIGSAFSTDNIQLCTAILSTRDVYYYVQKELKRASVEEEGEVTEANVYAAHEVAWACLTTLRNLSFVVPADETDMVEASVLRETHFDYEDNLIAAAAKRVKAECIVTSDEQMLKHQPYKCITPEAAIKLITKYA